MPLKSRKEKQRELIEERRREALQRLKEEERNFNLKKIQNLKDERIQRAASLRRSVEIFSSIDVKYKSEKLTEKIEQNWNSLFQRDQIRDASKSPQAVRDLLAILQIELDEFEAENLNWWLKCDEMSLLTQVNVPDTRRTVMRGDFQEKKEKFFKQQIKALLDINDRLAEIIEKKIVMENDISSRKLCEFRQIKHSELLKRIDSTFDKLSIEVAQHIDRQMDSINARESNYELKSSDFSISLCCFKDVPTQRDLDVAPMKKTKPDSHKIFKLNSLRCCLKLLKTRIDTESILVRGIWMKSDVHCDKNRSYFIQNRAYQKIGDLHSAVEQEMNVRDSLIEKQLDQMRQDRNAYEEQMRKLQELEEAQKQESKSNKSKGGVAKKDDSKKKKHQKKIEEPPIVDEATLVDVDDEYLAYEDEIYELRKASNSPAKLNLEPDELNMREFQFDGIFKIECFNKLCQPVSMYQHLHTNLPTDKLTKLIAVRDGMQMKPKKVAEKSKKTKNEPATEPESLIRVEIQLSENVFWWNQAPKVCRWEEPNFYKKSDRGKLFSAPPSNHFKRSIEVKDFMIDDSCVVEVNRYDLAKHYLVPSMPVEFRFFREQLDMFNRKCQMWRQIMKDRETFSEIEKRESAESLRKFIQNNCHIKWTADDLNTNFFMQNFEPKNLFPLKHVQMIEILSEIDFKPSRVTFELNNDGHCPGTLPKEHLKLSELLDQIETLQSSLEPFLEKEEEVAVEKKNLPLKESVSSASDVDNRGKWIVLSDDQVGFDSESKTLTFSLEKFEHFGSFALAAPKYLHLPFKSVEITPEEKTVCVKIVTQITTVIIKVAADGFLVQLPKVSRKHKLITSLENSKFATFDDLRQRLNSVNLMIFPEDDAVWYLQGSNEKHMELEKHTCLSMAYFSGLYEFKIVSPNVKLGRREIILELRKKHDDEEKIHEDEFKILKVTPLNATIVELNDKVGDESGYETSQAEVQIFHADLLSYLEKSLEDNNKNVISLDDSIEYCALTNNVSELCVNLRMFTYCY